MSYKVLVVDDKPLIRRALAETLDWEGLGCRLAGQAEDGLSAKRLVEELRPELLITDIKMPGMDGLALTEYVRNILPDTRILMITGYQEFEYARKALTLGVSDLILKPIRNDLLEEKIRKALLELEKHRNMANAVQNSKRARQEQLLAEIMKGRNFGDIPRARLEELSFWGKDCYLLLCRVRSGDGDLEKCVRESIIRYMRERQQSQGQLVFEQISGRYQVLLVFENEKRSARERKVRLKQNLHSLNQEIRKEYGVSLCFAVSRTSEEIRNLPRCLQETESLMEGCYFRGDESILFADSHALQPSCEGGSLLKELDHFYEALEQMEEEELAGETERILDEVLRKTRGDEFQVKCLLTEICITLLRRSEREPGRADSVSDTNRLMESINGLADKNSCQVFLLEYVRGIRKEAKRMGGSGHPLIEASVEYIHAHYRENISLSELAEQLSVNPSYLSRLFKKETGKNFVDVLTEYRIGRAKYLLKLPESRVVEVCEQVGYSDYTYFYQVFKRMEHISPSEYRKKSQKI